MIKRLVRKLIPEAILLRYHKYLSIYAAWKFKHPSDKLIVIGVTGTKGKSTTANMIWHVLTQAGYTVGLATTVNFKIGDKHSAKAWLNDKKMTMLGRTQLQALLQEMVDAGCQYAIVETSSEGIKQSRHLGIHYDIAVFTNLYPEHIDAHGSFENYKRAKQELFFHLSRLPRKILDGKPIHKTVVINADAEGAAEMNIASQVDARILWSQKEASQKGDANTTNLPINLQVSDVATTPTGLQFKVDNYDFTCPMLGEWNIDNIVSALAVGASQGMSYPQLQQAVSTIPAVPGRMEVIQTDKPFNVIVDYAYEPKSLSLVYAFLRKQILASTQPNGRIITLISSTGGGRDVSRRKTNGEIAAKLADLVIVTDEDPYDEDPMEIMKEVYAGVVGASAGKVEGENLWLIPDRKQAIQQAIALAQPGDTVLIPCKGAEQKMCLANEKKIDWDDREIARGFLG